jgi:CHRD domain
MRTALSRRAAIIAAAGLLLAAAAWTTGSALAAPTSFQVQLTGAGEVPAVQTAGTGTADLTYDPATRIVTWSITYSGFASPVTMAHFHRGAAGRNGPVVIWLSKRGTPPASPITGQATLTPAQAQQFLAGDWYVNVHTKDHPAGAARGQVVPPKG